jgi:hypothetical protein
MQGTISSTILEPNASTQVADASFFLSIFKFNGASDIMEQDTLSFRKAILLLSLTVKHLKGQENPYKPLSRLMNRRRL